MWWEGLWLWQGRAGEKGLEPPGPPSSLLTFPGQMPGHLESRRWGKSPGTFHDTLAAPFCWLPPQDLHLHCSLGIF